MTRNAWCRVLQGNIRQKMAPSAWKELVPQHEKDLLQWATALKVRAANSLPVGCVQQHTHAYCRAHLPRKQQGQASGCNCAYMHAWSAMLCQASQGPLN